jgi:hypothetical protein
VIRAFGLQFKPTDTAQLSVYHIASLLNAIRGYRFSLVSPRIDPSIAHARFVRIVD